MHNISYHAPCKLSDAVSLLLELEGSRILAGGTDLIAKWKKSHFFDMTLVDIRNIPELSVIEEVEEGLFIGAGVTMDRVSEDERILSKFPILAEAASKVGSVQVRNLATIGGNTCNAAPSADTVLPLMVYGAEAVIAAKEGERRVALREFFIGPGKTVLKKGDVLKGFVIPNPPANSFAYFVKHSRRPGMDLATVGVAVLLVLESEKTADIKVILGAVGPTPIFVKGLDIFFGGKIDPDFVTRIAEHCANAASPITDVRGSKTYREAMIKRSVALCFRNHTR